MTAVPTDARFTAAQVAALERIEAAPDAEESIRERVAVALYVYDDGTEASWRREPELVREDYRGSADAALAVLRPADVDGAL